MLTIFFSSTFCCVNYIYLFSLVGCLCFFHFLMQSFFLDISLDYKLVLHPVNSDMFLNLLHIAVNTTKLIFVGFGSFANLRASYGIVSSSKSIMIYSRFFKELFIQMGVFNLLSRVINTICVCGRSIWDFFANCNFVYPYFTFELIWVIIGYLVYVKSLWSWNGKVKSGWALWGMGPRIAVEVSDCYWKWIGKIHY